MPLRPYTRFTALCLLGLPVAAYSQTALSGTSTAQRPSSALTLATRHAAASPYPAEQNQDQDAPDATTGRLSQSDARLIKLENYIVDKVNLERRRLNLRPLATDSLLAEVARAHSAEMRDKKYFAHESPTAALRDPLDRYVLAFGDTPRLIAENIYRAWSTAPQPLNTARADEAHKSLMNSPGHRSNILEPDATRIGVGLVTNGNGDIWLTENFSRP